MMNEITTYNTQELKDKKLVSRIKKLNEAVTKDFNAKWLVADTIHDIITNELYAKDFETEQKLADFLGMKRSYMNRMKRASEYHKLGGVEIVEDGKTVMEYPLGDMSVTQIMELLPIPMESVFTVMKDYGIGLKDSCASIREGVTAWKEDKKALTDKASASSASNTEKKPSKTKANETEADGDELRQTTDEVLSSLIANLTEEQKTEVIGFITKNF